MKRGAGSAFISYLVVTLLLAWPVVRDIGQVIPSDLGDPVLNAWILWWNTTGLPFTERWWNPPVFFPATNVLAYSEHLFGISLISTPVYWLTGSPVVAYNVALLLTFPLSGVGVYLLCFELTGRRDASWLAGLAFAFAPYRMDQLAHLQVLSSYWMPLGLFALHRYYRDPHIRWLGLFSLCTLMTGLCNGYYLLFYPVLVLLWVLWFTPNQAWWRRVAAVGLAGALAVLVLSPTLLTYQRVHDESGFARGAGEIREYSADVSGLLSGPPRSVFWQFPDGVHRAEGQLFPGLTVAALVVIGLGYVRWRPRGPEPVALRVVRWVVGVVGLVFACGVLARVLVGPWEVAPFGIQISVDRPANIVAQGILFWVLWLVLSPVGAWAYRRHSAFAFYSLAAFVLFIFSLGPEPNAFGQDFMAHSAYKALTWLPGYDGLRVPARFWMLATICLSTLAGLAFVRLAPATRTVTWRRTVLAVAAVGILVDGWVVWPAPTAPARASLLDQAEGIVLELPLGNRNNDTASMWRSISHRLPLVNGFSGYVPPYYWALGYGLDHKRNETLDVLSGLGVGTIRINRRLDSDTELEQFVANYPGARLVAERADEALYRIPSRRGVSEAETYGAPLEVAEVFSGTDPDAVEHVLDGSLETRWEGGPQIPGQEIQVRMLGPVSLGAVVTELGPYVADFPRSLTIELSLDGEVWEVAWDGPTSAMAMVGALQYPRDVPLVFPLEGRVARYIRLRSTAGDPVYHWSIAELTVLAPSPG